MVLGKRVDIKVGFLCNNNCKFCVQAHNRHLGNKTTEQIKQELLEARKTCSEVVFTGGEPTIRPDILELVSYAKKLGFKTIQIQTNGRMLAYKKFCERLIDAGATEFSPALHGHIPELHDSLTRSKGSFFQTIKGIKNLRELGQFILTNTVVVKQNYRFLEQISRLLLQLKVNQYQLAFVHPIGNAYTNYNEVVPRMSDAAPYIKKALQIGIDAGINVMVEAVPYCMMQNYEEYLSEHYIPETQIRGLNYFTDNWDDVRRLEGKNKFLQCVSCKYVFRCEGPWKEYPERYGSKEFIPVKDLPKEVVIEVTSQCNLDCEFCFNKNSFLDNSQGRYRELDNQYIKRIIDSLVRNNIKEVRFTGGEPLLKQGIFELIRYAKSFGLYVRLNTNATLINKNIIKKIENYVDDILVPVNSYSPEKEKELTGREDSFEKKINNLKLLRKSKIPVVRCGSVATSDNIKNLEKIFRIIKKSGIEIWEVYRPIPIFGQENNITNEEFALLVEKLLILRKEGFFVPIANAVPFCAYDPEKVKMVSLGSKFDDGHVRFIIDPRKFAKPSYYWCEDIGNPLNIFECWNNKLMLDIRNLKLLPKECSGCWYAESCKGGSRFIAKITNGSVHSLDPLANPERLCNMDHS
jgi:radical SAM protein with 4Fe4S-binding SPASM domain